MAMKNEERKVERRSSPRQFIPEVLVELRRDVDSETLGWVKSAVDISLNGMLLQLPLEVALGDFLYVGFTLCEPRTPLRGLRAVVLSRRPRGPLRGSLLVGRWPAVRTGDLGVLGFTGWPLEKEYELAAWLKRTGAEEAS